MIATASHSRSTSSSWWQENTTGTPVAAYSAQHAAQHVDADRVEAGERLVEHEQLRARARAPRRAARAAGCRARAPRRGRRRARPARAARSSGRPRPRVGRADAVQRGEVDELVAHAHLRVQPALLRHVAEAPPRRGVDGARRASAPRRGRRASTPRTIRIVGRLAGPVGADEAEHLPRLDGEATRRRARPGRRKRRVRSIELEAAASRLRPARRGPAAARGRAGPRR